MKCPNRNTQQWKDLEAKQGETMALYLWDKYDGLVPQEYYGNSPTFARAKDIITKISREVGITNTGFIFTDGKNLSDSKRERINEIITRYNANYRGSFNLIQIKNGHNKGNYMLREGNNYVVYNVNPGSQTITTDAAITILDTFKKKFNVNYQIVSPEEAAVILENAPQQYNGEEGFYYNDMVYIINKGHGIDMDTAIHEYGHPFMRALNKYNPNLFKSIVADIAMTSEGQDILNEIRQLKYKESEVPEELAVRALTKLASKNFDPKTGGLFQNAVDKLIRFLTSMLRNVFGKQDLKVGDISVDTTLQQLADIFSLKTGKIDLKNQNQIKPGVQELFDSNPELANQVYETLGFKYLKNFDGNVELLASDIASNYDGAKKASDFISDIKNDLQQAQQQYSQYLDSIFPNSKVKDIVYHGAMESQLPKDGKFKGYVTYFTDVKNYAETVGFPINRKVIQAIINIKAPYNAVSDLADVPQFVHDSDEFTNPRIIKANSTDFDSVIGTDVGQKEGRTIAVFEPEQIHILGNAEDVKGFAKFVNEGPSFNRTFSSQKEVYQMIDPRGKISKNANEEYVVLGETGYKRVTEVIRKSFSLNNKEASKAQTLGNVFHAIAANRVKEAFPDYNLHFNALTTVPGEGGLVDLNSLPQKARQNILDIINPIIKQAKANGSVLVAELTVANTTKKLAGTIDLLEITKDNKLRSLDYKTTMNQGSVKSNYKTYVGNSKQQEIYNQILSTDDEKLGRSGIKIGYQALMKVLSYVNKKGEIGYRVLNTDFGDKTYPVIYQETLNKKRNEMLSVLFEQLDHLADSYTKDNADKIDALIKAKTLLMMKIQKDVESTDILLTAMNDLIAIESFLSENKTDKSYIEFKQDLLLYENIGDYIAIDDKNRRLIEQIQGRAKTLTQMLYGNVEQELTESIAKDLAFEGSPVQSAEDVLKPVEDINMYQSLAKGLSYTNNPLLAGMYKKVTEALARTRNKAAKLGKNIEKAVRDLESYMGSTGEKIYEPLLQYKDGKKTGYIVDKYSPSFYQERKKAKSENNDEWYKKNTTFDKDAYEKRLKNYKEYLEHTFKAALQVKIKTLRDSGKYKEDIIEAEAEKYVKKDQKATLDKWILLNNNLKSFNIPNDSWIDPKWRDIKQGKYKGTAVEKFYDLYIGAMEEIEDNLPFDIRSNFIADFKRSFLNKVINTGIGNMKLGQSFMDSILLHGDEAEFSKVNPFTGEFMRKIPIIGKKTMTASEREEFVATDKSYDLGYSLSLFYESAVRYQELSLIEDTVKVSVDLLMKQKKQLTTSTGDLAKGGFNLNKVAVNLQNSIDQYEYFVNNVFYGKSEDPGVGIKVTGNSLTEKFGMLKKDDEAIISLNKGLNSILRYTGLLNLGYNLYSPVTNILGGKLMQYISAAGGRWFSIKDYNFATAVVTAGPLGNAHPDIKKAHLFIEMFKLQSNEYQEKTNKELSTGFKGVPELLKPMAAMANTEANMQNTGLIAMIKSNKNSIKWDEWEVKNDELVYKGEAKPSEGDMEAFRQKVIHVNGRSIGNMNPDDKIRAKQYFIGRAVSQHRGWIPAMLEAHYSSRRYDYQLQDYTEGRINSLFKYIYKLTTKEKIDDIERAGAKEAIAEIGAMVATYLLYAALKGSDEDKERRKKLAYWIKIANRLNGELTFFSPLEFSSKHQILISPAPSVSSIEKLGRAVGNVGDVLFGDEEESEKAKKKTGKKFRQLVPYWSQGERFLDDVIYNDIEDNK